MKTLALLACLSLGLSGCGVIYFAPTVSEQATDAAVAIVPVTAAAVKTANASPYRPQQVPAVFLQTADDGSSGLQGIGALPDPVFTSQTRPGMTELRLPPDRPDRPYEIGVGDVLVLATQQSARSIEELSGLLSAQNQRQGYTVQDDGAIAVPDVGRIRLAGLDLEEAEAEVFQSLVSAGLDPTFSIEVAEFNSKRATIGGAVRNPTVVPISLTPVTVQEALAAAGGVASLDTQFTTIRLYRSGTLYQIPLDQLPGTDVELAAGDSIFVDTDYQLDRAQAYFEEQITLANQRQSSRLQALNQLSSEIGLRRAALNEARANFQAQLDLDAIDRDHVYLTGEVAQKGRFPLPFGRQASLADALFEQGGLISDISDPGQIYLLRGNADGQVTAYHLNGRNTVNLLHATNMELRPNDIIFVAPQPITSWNRALNQITPSLVLAQP
ncbi:polysaccharide biosynthesis/export family protein [Roseovarius sp.]|uniref:polysaccharide biosynthesis/export family protein n=1 Tax=Roseovarius sp. TaxID=1486281 RepID=UPI003569C3F0